ncbi:ABC transporter permease subunit [Rhizosaccharibacter radicis]|uniref:Ribose ABC transporter permease n=1 Tax=Rhizosaccharibacter radicis TaxID=2782605 RepID=A0ABT1VTV0_9PROT|nr:ribose ABC transporter permease [Acetobacteraceae bacterium KSS12]
MSDATNPTSATAPSSPGTSANTAGTPPPAGAGLSARQVQIRSLVQAAGMLPVLILLAIGFHVLGGHRFLSAQNLSIVAQQASINCVLGAGMTFVILTGGIDLSVGSILAASAMGALIVSLMGGLSWLAIPACLAVGLLIGLVNGSLVAFVKLPPFIVTLGTLTAVRGLARLMGADNTVFNPQLSYAWIGNDGINLLGFTIPWLAIIAIAVIVASWYVLRRTVLGVRIYAVGGNPAAARLSGINVPVVLMFVYALSGLLAGLGGVMSSARLYAANGLQLGQSYELDAIAAVILGGTSFVGGIGSIWGTLIGALIIAVLSNGLILVGVSDIWQFIVKGLVIIGAVALDRFRQGSGTRT